MKNKSKHYLYKFSTKNNLGLCGYIPYGAINMAELLDDIKNDLEEKGFLQGAYVLDSIFNDRGYKL